MNQHDRRDVMHVKPSNSGKAQRNEDNYRSALVSIVLIIKTIR